MDVFAKYIWKTVGRHANSFNRISIDGMEGHMYTFTYFADVLNNASIKLISQMNSVWIYSVLYHRWTKIVPIFHKW